MTALNLLVLVLAGHRVFHLVAADTITKRWRERILGWDDDQRRNGWPRDWKRLAEFIHCPWCLGFWIAVSGWIAFQHWPHATMTYAAWPLAISSGIALIISHE